MISRSIIQFTILYIYFEYHYFVLNFRLILCHLQVTSYKDRICLIYDYIILGFNYYSIKFINDYIILELNYCKNSSLIRFQKLLMPISIMQWRVKVGMFFRKFKVRYRDRILLTTIRPLFFCSSGFRFVFITLILHKLVTLNQIQGLKSFTKYLRQILVFM